MTDERDPLDSSSTPSLSFKDSEPGDTKYIDVSEPAGPMVQSRNFDTGEPDFWPAKNGIAGGPKMAVVLNGKDENGDDVSVWAVKPSAMFTALIDAQKALRVAESDPLRRIGGGPNIDRVYIKHESSQRPKSGRGNDQKVYKAKVTPQGPKAAPKPAADDPFADEPPF